MVERQGQFTMANKTDGQVRNPDWKILVAAVLITACAIIVLFELFSSQALIYRYRHEGVLNDGKISSLVLLRKAASKLGWITEPDRFDLECVPSPCLKKDPIFGWSVIPGEFTLTFKRRTRDLGWESLPVKVTINPDQSRWTGMPAQSQKPTIYIFGDSFVIGSGVNDEQTFAYHLQMAKPQYNVKLFAGGGYSLVHSYLRMEQLKSQISERDIVIIGYADFYDVRNVAAPSRLRDIEHWYQMRLQQVDASKIPKASIGDNNKLSISLVTQDCQIARSYCGSNDPPLSEMRAVSLRLIHEIAEASRAKTYLLHFDGSKDNPVPQNCGIEVISALQEDFGYFIRDDIVGFDPHPGPYWHYAIARKLISRIN